MLPVIGRDLLMLENQLPLSVLQTLYDLTSLTDNQTPLFKLAIEFFKNLRPFREKISEEIWLNNHDHYPHLLALFQSSFVHPSMPLPSIDHQESIAYYDYNGLTGNKLVSNATTLTSLGIKLLGSRSVYHDHLPDIRFKKRLLFPIIQLPTLFLDDGTIPLLRNLIAYEQSYRYTVPYFTCLAFLFYSLVDTPSDVDILRSSGIIKLAKGTCGNDQVVDLLKSLTKELEFGPEDCYIIKKVIEDINDYCQSSLSMAKAQVRTLVSKVDLTKIFLGYISILATKINAQLNPAPTPTQIISQASSVI